MVSSSEDNKMAPNVTEPSCVIEERILKHQHRWMQLLASTIKKIDGRENRTPTTTKPWSSSTNEVSTPCTMAKMSNRTTETHVEPIFQTLERTHDELLILWGKTGQGTSFFSHCDWRVEVIGEVADGVRLK
jgi:hypothetical protein